MNIDEIAALLHIAEKSAGHPQLKNITNAALAELKKHNDGEREPLDPPPVPEEYDNSKLKNQPASIMPGQRTFIGRRPIEPTSGDV